MLHLKVVLIEPEFTSANVEVVDGGAGDVRLVWIVFERKT